MDVAAVQSNGREEMLVNGNNNNNNNDQVPAANTVQVPTLTSIMKITELRLIIMGSLQAGTLYRIRYVNKEWDNWIEEGLTEKDAISVGIYREGYSWYRVAKLYDYHIRGMVNFRRLLQRHIKVKQLHVVGHVFNADDVFSLHSITLITQLDRLQHLKLIRFAFFEQESKLVESMTQLVSLDIDSSFPIGVRLSRLGDNIRNLGIHGRVVTDLMGQMQTLSDRQIPLERFSLSRGGLSSRQLVGLAQFMLSNFESLRVLELTGHKDMSVAYYTPPLDSLASLVAVNIEELKFVDIQWCSFLHFTRFIDSLIFHPLPKLTKMVWRGNNFKLDQELVWRIHQNCESLAKMELDGKWIVFDKSSPPPSPPGQKQPAPEEEEAMLLRSPPPVVVVLSEPQLNGD